MTGTELETFCTEINGGASIGEHTPSRKNGDVCAGRLYSAVEWRYLPNRLSRAS